ncbi:MAG: DUF4129 domain-containing protein [Chloroflexi bacterium]|nr:DUF4129 domain-containing protein [Chloroflexota bacterium]
MILVLFMVLTVFLGSDILLSGFSDRLLLSRYLVFGLVIGSFDLMLRRNVIASVILGALVLILVSEFALSWWFVIFCLLFTFLALNAIIVSRFDTTRGQTVLIGEFGWRDLGKLWLSFGTAFVLISAVFFLLMPRLAINQVTQASWLPSRLDLSLAGLSLLPSEPSVPATPGMFPSQVDSSGGRYATLGYTGSSPDEPVMYVRSRISSYWRGLTLDEYDGRGWLSSFPEISRLSGTQGEFVVPDARRTGGEENAYWQIYYLLSDQPNAIFAGYSPRRIYLPTTVQAFLEEGALYRAFSVVPNLRPEQLRADRAVNNDIKNTALPPVSDRVAALAESIVQGARNDYDKAARLERFLITTYSYDLTVEALPPGSDAVDFFLFEKKAGYCSHFATAMAVMARHVGLPARVAAGYLPGTIDTMTGAHIVRAADAHAWVEINFRRYGWVAFDPTPRADATSGFGSGHSWLYWGLQNISGITFTGILSMLKGTFSFAQLSISQWIWAVLPGAAVAALAAVLLMRRRRINRKTVREYTPLKGESRQTMLKLYRRMEMMLVRKGLPERQPHQSPLEYAAAVSSQCPLIAETVAWLTRAASNAAYDPEPFNASLIREAEQKLSSLRRTAIGRRQRETATP